MPPPRREPRSGDHRPADDTGEPAFSLFEVLHQPVSLLWWSNPEENILNKVLRADLEQAVLALPESFRTVVILSDLEGFKYPGDRRNAELAGRHGALAVEPRTLAAAKALWQQAQAAGLSAHAPDAQDPPNR